MSFYKITLGQLITLWVFGMIVSLVCLVTPSLPIGIFSLLIPGILIFYTLGWRKNNKSKSKNKLNIWEKVKMKLAKIIFKCKPSYQEPRKIKEARDISKIYDFRGRSFFDQTNLFKLLFSFEGRINRLRLLEGFLTAWGCLVVTGIILSISTSRLGLDLLDEKAIADIFRGLASFFLVFTVLSLYVKRSHDLGWNGWAVLLICVPLVNIIYLFYFLFVSGDIGDNKYGKDPLGRKKESA
ncbi:MAG: DUF805 domain-containing protein [Candidatus Gracilibacteria bacterium]|nr:DUF805 domain-containing protein [Candidatus Gracilibacteria bacterium]MDD5179153.1 DUF805 domain-containing protein [Candidatus Gracilibacteria bacterium]